MQRKQHGKSRKRLCASFCDSIVFLIPLQVVSKSLSEALKSTKKTKIKTARPTKKNEDPVHKTIKKRVREITQTGSKRTGDEQHNSNTTRKKSRAGQKPKVRWGLLPP